MILYQSNLSPPRMIFFYDFSYDGVSNRILYQECHTDII